MTEPTDVTADRDVEAAEEIAAALLPLIQEREARAWDAGATVMAERHAPAWEPDRNVMRRNPYRAEEGR